ncbi:MAG TPA: DUF938 domain-containing protein [Polyangiaceae bacterium]|nr:DUF938 domain-containing protein [Polyangiaceae bacterium]
MKRHAPAAERNKEVIVEVLAAELRNPCTLLEIASGTGQHAVHIAGRLPHVVVQPSDVSVEAVASIAAYRAEAALDNLRAPVTLDVESDAWPELGAVEAMLCCNMIHIAPWSAAEGLFRGAGRVLPSGAPVFLYGPFRFDGRYTAQSNAAFDASLRDRDPSWGVRDVADLTSLAQDNGLSKERVFEMPANNHVILFRRQ